ncbi:OLC1v1015844C1 [Oldenlandia corymbosa var. corymbosa]|uniref:OLC1v1015844C1 n=1 Tax=Oldenlandia corymbosa var. corymbosa TaxID=529605 RepID=A0AAV1E6D2_OLDCO|nr:OLC1v1015844C1 [Oldenlandia corymbosa var. corymbosa]
MVALLLAVSISFKSANSDPQTTLLNEGCNTKYRADNITNVGINFNASLADLRNQISEDNTHFAAAQEVWTSDPVFMLFQCRNYLYIADCVSCFDTAASQINKCYPYNGARFLSDGCYLRKWSDLWQSNSMTANWFQTQTEALLQDLKLAIPRMNGFFAASKWQLSYGSDAVYAVAQCTETVSQSGCEFCLKLVYDNIDVCLPNTDGRGFDAGCFMRYSATPFFADNQTTDIKPYVGGGGGRSRNTKVIIGGVVAGLILVIPPALLLSYRLYRKPKKVQTKARKICEIKQHLQLVDKTMDPNEYDVEEVKKVLEIATICTQSQPSERPTLSEVVVLRRCLSSTSEPLLSNSNATASFTDFTGR